MPVSTDSTGAGSAPSTNFEPLPFRVGFAVYRDTNSNSRWDPSRDDTLYRGDGTVTTCPQP